MSKLGEISGPGFRAVFSKKVEEPVGNSVSYWQEQIHSLAKEKGFYEGTGRSDTESLMLAVCELSEAVEQIRAEKPSYYEVDGKPEGVAVEVADAVIRLMDLAGYRGWNLEEIMTKKHEYNKTRPYKHGKKF